MKIGSHVSMSGKEMLLGSVKEALSYGANTFMVYTGAPQNTKRKAVEELNIENAQKYMMKNDIDTFVVHAPYIINLANSINQDIYKLGVDFLAEEINRTIKMGSNTIVLHPGSHVGAGIDIGIDYIADGLNQILTKDTDCFIALETMAGKGSEIGRNFEELAKIYDMIISFSHKQLNSLNKQERDLELRIMEKDITTIICCNEAKSLNLVESFNLA